MLPPQVIPSNARNLVLRQRRPWIAENEIPTCPAGGARVILRLRDDRLEGGGRVADVRGDKLQHDCHVAL